MSRGSRGGREGRVGGPLGPRALQGGLWEPEGKEGQGRRPGGGLPRAGVPGRGPGWLASGHHPWGLLRRVFVQHTRHPPPRGTMQVAEFCVNLIISMN